ncbi:DUF2956 domain-containing protein [Psychrobium sp. 1_MG-2023]|uniref:DUF2956 domain-containing protein n=1 Tax=Psychrobium sp. 1_MG-2023 TaxID=3062624 RepID=UPI000C341833|nr:DUF2956 domain-containing protein [Psychrobium sp. 1_MG-2023]MDP2560080.1 DUF2956 domain-containing protein [Psychrobium sp. 1_MG-2023]PKF56261.1 DUF2956 domain-containing protein [Alteromonadales bacterium alter-6D02]
MPKSKQDISETVQQESLAVAKATQKKGQTKEQTKLIAAGIEKGIAQYKKQHKAKLREQDKQRKKTIKQRQASSDDVEVVTDDQGRASSNHALPWILLVLSWLGFGAYLFFVR